jgi:4-hydroxyacetophenone monooxygenase
MDTFKGLSFHSARWPDGLDVTGKRVAVVGSGATGYQTTPEIAKIASHAYLFQRTPSWCYDDPNYVRPLSPQAFWLDRNFPFYPNFARFRLTALGGPDAVVSLARIDPNFKDPHARSAPNKAIRDERIAFLQKKLAAKPELIEKMTPIAPPMSSRPIRIDAQDSILDALLRDNVTLVSDKIERITPTGIVAGGVEHPVDIIVYATGFKAQDYLWPMDVRGKNGLTVEQLWSKDGARAYLGAMIPGFPNFWMGYGPNTNNFGGFQVIDLLEIIMRFAMLNIAGLIENNLKSVEVTEDAYWRFNDELDRNEKLMIYMDPRVQNYYQNGSGRSCVNGPVDIRRMWRWMRDPAGKGPAETDAGMRPYFGEDLLVV